MVDLDSACGATFTYRDLLECSNTWKDGARGPSPIDNVPREAATFEALRALAVEILDPVAREFGRPVVTYGFGGPALTKRIPKQIAPHLDQHASHERGQDAPICHRLGAAVDFFVPGMSSLKLARWVFEHLHFDRIYFYGEGRPIHVSHGPEATRAVVELREAPSGRQVPRLIRW